MIDHCPNGDLTDLVQLVERMGKLRAMRTEIYLHAMAQIVSVLEYLHLQGVQHRDVKVYNG